MDHIPFIWTIIPFLFCRNSFVHHSLAHRFHLRLLTKTFYNSIWNKGAMAWAENGLHLLSMPGGILTITRGRLRVRGTEFDQWSELRPISADTATHPSYCSQHPVQPLFDDHRDGVKEGIRAAHPQEYQETICNLVSPGVLMVLSLATDKVPEAHCAERHKAEVEGLRVSPALHGRIESGSPACNQQSDDGKDERDLVYGWFRFFIFVAFTGSAPRSDACGSSTASEYQRAQ